MYQSSKSVTTKNKCINLDLQFKYKNMYYYF